MGKRVLITGSNKGIGYGLASKILAELPEFDKIIITSRNLAEGLAAKESLGGGDRLDHHILDITSQESINNLRDYISATYGTIDVLINNAAIFIRGHENRHLVVKVHVETNFYGLKNMTEAFLPLLQPAGQIVNISAGYGKTQYLENPALAERFLKPDLTLEEIMEIGREFEGIGEDWEEKGWKLSETWPYVASKVIMNAYSRVLARDLAAQGSGIRVNAVHPGWVRTEMGTDAAELSLEEGCVMPFKVLTDTNNISGKYWEDGHYEDFS